MRGGASGLWAALVMLLLVGAACGGSGPAPTESPLPGVSPAPTASSGPTGGPEGEMSTTQLVEALRPSVVHILTESATLGFFGQVVPQQGVGTGFIIDEQGHIVTNNHVVTNSSGEAADRVTVTLSDGREFKAEIVGRDPPTDLAVLKIDAGGLKSLRLGRSAELKVGEDVVAIGNALNLPGGPTVTKGVVSALGRLIDEGDITIPDAIQTDAAINPGNSGGPLVNMRGEVVGITTAIITQSQSGVQAQGIGLAIAIDTAKPIVDELVAKGEVDRGVLGVRGLVVITPSLKEQFGLAVDHGIGIRQVVTGGPAARAGLEAGDIIVSLAGREITTTGDLFKALTEHRAGETVEVEYYHNAQKKKAEITLG